MCLFVCPLHSVDSLLCGCDVTAPMKLWGGGTWIANAKNIRMFLCVHVFVCLSMCLFACLCVQNDTTNMKAKQSE